MHGRRLGLVTITAALTLGVAACGAGSDGAGGTSGAAAPVVTRAAPATTAGCAQDPVAPPDGAVTIPIPATTVRLDDPGAEPRAVIALKPAAVQRTSLFSNSLQVSQLTGDQASGGNRDVTVPITAQPACANPLRVALFFGAPTSTDPATQAALAKVAGTVGRVTLAANGSASELALAAPAGIDPSAQGLLEQALLQTFTRAVPLPAEPIGAGARWTVTRTLRGETTLTETMHVTLAGDPARPTLKAEVDEEPENDVFTIPGSTQTLRIDSFTSAGGAELRIDPGLPLPVSGSLQLQGGRSLSGGEDAKTLVQKTGFTYRWQP